MTLIFRKMAGVTLLELLVTVTILATTISLSAPLIGSAVSNNQLATTTSTLRRTVALARSEAIKRGRRVIMCLSGDLNTCNTDSAKYALVFEDIDRTGIPSTGEGLISVINLNHTTLTVSYNRPRLAYAPTGHAAGTNGTFKVCHQNGQGELIIVSTLGRARQAVDYDGDGLVEKVPGDPISC